ncbi:PIF1 protein [Hirsutella rhossiliensis]|uniref:PIF1 protein n=1 Tax=Hirsutella rhossiliensis TaxID=111463 RepID=A0A9P8SF73_9HYPO|nr:PIF1 protein [Hirsutella rhossiliensis]KAH0959764.1 PIF1 protein [Hirsutella rhossiliensis]
MHLHGRLGCEHAYPDELKDLTPLEEKLISLNSCYGFVTKYSIPGGRAPAVGKAVGGREGAGLAQENNPLYGEVEIDAAEIASWGRRRTVPPVVCERLERNEPSARERTQTAQVVPPSERAMDDGGAAEIEEVLAMLRQGQDPAEEPRRRAHMGRQMWPTPRRFASPATRSGPRRAPAEDVGRDGGQRAAGDGGDGEPYIQVRRGEDFADSADASFFAKAFPTLFPLGAQAERVAEGLMSTRNMKLQAWADVVLRRHGGRFATHPIFAFLVFNMGVRSKNRQASMLGVARKNFARVEGLLKSLTAQRLEAARAELEATGKTSDDGVKELLRSLSVFGYRQPMSRESRLSMRKKILSLIVSKVTASGAPRPRPDEAEAFLSDLGTAYKRTRLAISDPMSSAVFFHREMTLFFEHYVNVGEESVFGHVGAYYGRGNAGIGDALAGPDAEEQAAYRERIVRYVDSVFSEELDAEGYCAMQAERSATADISSRLDDVARFTDTFDEEANFCAGATQIHTHSATCAPWRLVERTALTADGVLEIRRTHSMVNRWNRAMAVGLRHNHDISFIATQRKTMALIYYITNYATKVEDPVWKRVAAAAEFLPVLEPTGEGNRSGADRDGNKTRTFLLKAANRVFTERPLSQVEVIAHLLGYPAEFSSGSAWAYINANQLYWAVFRRWRHLRRASGAEATGDAPDETALRRPGCGATVCVDGYLSKEFSEEDDESCHRRAAVQHLALFVPWSPSSARRQATLTTSGHGRGSLAPRVARLADNVQLLRRSAEDAKRDAKQWAATAEEGGMTAPQADDEGRGGRRGEEAYRAGGAGDAARLIDVVRNAASAGQVTAQSTELLAMTQQLCRFQQSALGSAAELAATVVADERAVAAEERGAGRERAIQGIQGGGAAAGVGADRGAALRGVMGGFGEDDIDVTAADGDADAGTAAGMRVRLGPSSSFVAAGRSWRASSRSTKQAIALLIVCRQLDRIRQGDDAGGDGGGQLCLFIGGEGGTGKSRVIEALVELLARRTYRAGSACSGRTHAANEQLCRLRGSARDFGGIPVVILCGDFHQFRPVQERSILLPSAAVAWDEDGAFAAEQRRRHDKAHALWRRFTTVVMLTSRCGPPATRSCGGCSGGSAGASRTGRT